MPNLSSGEIFFAQLAKCCNKNWWLMLIIRLNGWATVANIVNQSSSKLWLATRGGSKWERFFFLMNQYISGLYNINSWTSLKLYSKHHFTVLLISFNTTWFCLSKHAGKLRGFPHSSVGEESACNAGDRGLIPGLGRSPGEGNGNPFQYSCLENPMDRGAWQSLGHKSRTWLSD